MRESRLVLAAGLLLAPASAQAGFEPVSGSGPPFEPAESVVLTDLDGDGHVDFVSASEQIWLGAGDGTFVEGPSCSPAGPPVIADFDNDGRRDVFRVGDGPTICYGQDDGSLLADTDSVEPNPSAGMDSEGMAASGAAALDIDGDGWLELYMTNYEAPGMVWFPDVIYVNDGMGGLDVAAEIPWAMPGRGVTAGDFDEDGDPDLYVSNYRLVLNYLWRNNGAGGIFNEAEALGAQGGYAHTISSAFGDLDGDGHLDIFVCNFAHPGQPETAILLNEVVDGGGFLPLGNGDIAWQESHAGVALADYDLDGDLDAFVTTVYPGDTGRLHQNRGDGTFVDVTQTEGLAGQTQGYAAAWGDVDEDGDPDLWLGGQQPDHLFLNQAAQGHWLELRLRGDGTRVNATAVGARVTVRTDDLVVVREVQAEGGERGGNDLALRLGLGSHTGPVDVEVHWPWAERCTYEAMADTRVEIDYTAGCDDDPGAEDTGETDDTGHAESMGGSGESSAGDDETGVPAQDAGDASGCGCAASDSAAPWWLFLALALPTRPRPAPGRPRVRRGESGRPGWRRPPCRCRRHRSICRCRRWRRPGVPRRGRPAERRCSSARPVWAEAGGARSSVAASGAPACP